MKSFIGSLFLLLLLFSNASAHSKEWLMTLPEDTTTQYTAVVTGRDDPNNMTANPEQKITYSPEKIQYTIEFQNLGKDTAFNVKVVEKYPADIAIRQIHLLSHSGVEMDVTTSAAGIEFFFKDIKLSPKSVNETASKGYVTFDMYLKDTMKIGQIINNSASIYFDYEPGVITNTAWVQRVKDSQDHSVTTVKSGSSPFNVYPNPGSNILNIELKSGTALQDAKFYTLEGREVQALQHADKSFDISSWAQGFYLLNLEVDGKHYVYKYMKVE